MASALVVIACSVASAVATQYATKRFVYDLPAYKQAADDIERANARIAELKQLGGKRAANAQVAIADAEDKKQKIQTFMASMSMRSTLIMGALNIAMFWVLSSLFSGVVMLKLPFEPFGFLTGITHRGLEGEDMRDASFVFVYALTSMVVQPLVTKLMGTEQAGGAASPFTSIMEQLQKRR